MSIQYSLDKRCKDILQNLLNAAGYVNVQDLADEMQVSKRSTYYDITKIDEWLLSNNLPITIKDRSKGIMIDSEDKLAIQSLVGKSETIHNMVLTPTERINLEISLMIVRDNPLYVDDFMNYAQVSRNTILNDLKGVSNILASYNLELTFDNKHGYRIMGDIIKRRALFFMLFPTLWDYAKAGLVPSWQSNDVYKNLNKLHEIEKQLHAEYVSGVLEALAVFLSSIENRHDHVNFSDMDEEEIIATREYELVSEYFVELRKDELIYISLHLLGSRLQSGPVNVMKEEETIELAKLLVDEFERISCITYEDKDDLINAIQLHLKMSLYRYRYGIQLGNPLLDNIKTEYTDLFCLTKKAIVVLEKQLNVMISDAEVAYLTLHFGAFIPNKHIDKPFRILIICPNGIGAGNMLKKEVETLVPQASEITNLSLSKYQADHNYDLVISTVVLPEEEKLIVVHPILTDQDRVAILKNCIVSESKVTLQIDDIMKIAKNYMDPSKLSDFKRSLQEFYASEKIQSVPKDDHGESILYHLKPSHIQIVDEEMDYEDALRTSCKPLVDENYVSTSYVDSILNDQRNKGLHMFISDEIVLAHSAIEAGVNKVGCTFSVYKHPIHFGNGNDAKIIIALAAENETSHMHILSDILDIFAKKTAVDQIWNAKDSNEILDIIASKIQTN